MSFNPWLVSEQDPVSQSRATKYVYMGLSITIGLVTFLVYLFIWYLCTRHRRNRNLGSLPHSQPGAGGLTKSALAALPISSYSGPDKDAAASTDCAVCISQFQKGDRVRRLPKCNHMFHVDCVDMWLYSHSTCPICRCEVGEKEASKKPDSSRVAAIPPVGQPSPVPPALLGLPPV